MSIPLAFVICTEPGRLEPQSLMLAESIRKFCGNLKDTPIYSFHPRNWYGDRHRNPKSI